MIEFLKNIDIFAIDFAFTTFTKQKFQTYIGGLMTIDQYNHAEDELIGRLQLM